MTVQCSHKIARFSIHLPEYPFSIVHGGFINRFCLRVVILRYISADALSRVHSVYCSPELTHIYVNTTLFKIDTLCTYYCKLNDMCVDTN